MIIQSNLDKLNRKAEWPSGIRRGQIARERKEAWVQIPELVEIKSEAVNSMKKWEIVYEAFLFQ